MPFCMRNRLLILLNCRRALRISYKRGCPAVQNVPVRPLSYCKLIVANQNPGMFPQVTIPNLVIIILALTEMNEMVSSNKSCGKEMSLAFASA